MKNRINKDKISQNVNHKVNIRVKGNLRHLIYKLHALIEASRLGLKTTKLIKHQPGQLELEFEGDKTKLWRMVKWCKGRHLSSVEEIVFSFTSINL